MTSRIRWTIIDSLLHMLVSELVFIIDNKMRTLLQTWLEFMWFIKRWMDFNMRWAEGEARQNLRRREGLLKEGALNVQRLLGLMSGDRWATKFMNVLAVCPSFISTNCSQRLENWQSSNSWLIHCHFFKYSLVCYTSSFFYYYEQITFS